MNANTLLSQLKNAVVNLEFYLSKDLHDEAAAYAFKTHKLAFGIYTQEREKDHESNSRI